MRALAVLSSGAVATAAIAAEWQIEVSGNERTQTSYIEALANRCLEQLDPASPSFETDLGQCLLNARIFAKAEARRAGPDRLAITVEDRWTLIVVPLISGDSSGKTSYGAAAVESNLFGRGKSLFAFGTLGSRRSTIMASAFDPSISFSSWQGSLEVQKTSEDADLEDDDGLLDSFHEAATRYAAGLGYVFPASSFRVKADLEYRDRSYEMREGFIPPPEVEALVGVFNLSSSSARYKFYFDEGFRASLTARTQLWRSDSDRKSSAFEFRLSLGTYAFLDHALVTGLMAAWMPQTDRRDAFRLGGSTGFRGFPRNSQWAQSAVAGSMEYLIPVSRADYGTWTVSPFVDAGAIRRESPQVSRRPLSYVSWGGGLFLYLKEVNVPGLGLTYSESSVLRKPTFGFSIGPAM